MAAASTSASSASAAGGEDGMMAEYERFKRFELAMKNLDGLGLGLGALAVNLHRLRVDLGALR